jgi:hypothetical protein
VARQEAATARLDEIQPDPAERNKKHDELLEKRDNDIRAMKEAIPKLVGRLPPPPPRLRSA